mmetsp:Transcript_37315/g.59927  ORF Transcript_37315/g.59927 Transcript_37315/m.59927 type:complete len:210 (+) Transcript_37315:1643-2272(+)
MALLLIVIVVLVTVFLASFSPPDILACCCLLAQSSHIPLDIVGNNEQTREEGHQTGGLEFCSELRWKWARKEVCKSERYRERQHHANQRGRDHTRQVKDLLLSADQKQTHSGGVEYQGCQNNNTLLRVHVVPGRSENHGYPRMAAAQHPHCSEHEVRERPLIVRVYLSHRVEGAPKLLLMTVLKGVVASVVAVIAPGYWKGNQHGEEED